MSELNIFKNLVKIAYVNPKYRYELFCLLGMSFKQHNFRMADANAAVKIQEDAKQGIFSGYTLGVLSAFYTNKNRKFKNPNPEGKDEIAMSTLAKYYSERENNPAYKKFEGQTISELQKAFNEFYSEFERQQKTNKELKEKDENVEEDQYEGMDEEEIADAKKREEKMSPAMRKMREKMMDKYKEQEKDQILKAKTGELYSKIFNALDEIDPFRSMSPEKESEEVEKLYKVWEDKFFETKEDGKVYLKTGMEDSEKTRQIVRDILRDNLTDEKIDDMFNETGKHRHGTIGKFLNPIVDDIAVKTIMKTYTENLERQSHMLVGVLTLANKGWKAIRKETGDGEGGEIQEKDFENPEFVKKYLDYIDKKYGQQIDPEVRLSMRKNTKAMITMVKNLSDATGATDAAKQIVSSAIESVQNSEKIQNAFSKTKDVGKKIFDGVMKTQTTKIETSIRDAVRDKFKHEVVDTIASVAAGVTGVDKGVIGSAILEGGAGTDKLLATLKEKGIALEKEQIQTIVSKLKEDIETFKTEGTADALAKVSSQLDSIKIDPTSFEDSILSKAGSLADLADKANDVYTHTATRVARATLNALEGDIDGVKKSFAEDLETSIKNKVADSINKQLSTFGLLKEGDSISADELSSGFGVDKWLNPLKEKTQQKIESATNDIITNVKSLSNVANDTIEGLEVPSAVKNSAKEMLSNQFTDVQTKIQNIGKNLEGKAKEQLDLMAQNIKKQQEELEKSAAEGIEKSYTDVFKSIHSTIEQAKSQANIFAEGAKGFTDEAKKQVVELDKMYDELEKNLKQSSKFFGVSGSEQIEQLLKVADQSRTTIKNQIGQELTSQVDSLQKQMEDMAVENTTSILDSAGGAVHGMASVLGTSLGFPLTIATKKVLSAFTDSTFYSEVEKEGGESAVLHQKMLNHKILPQDIDDDFRTKAKEIMSASIPVEEKIEKLRSLQYRYDEEARPVIAKALYQLGKRDATGNDIDGYFKQKAEYLKRGSDDDLDFSTFFIRKADGNDILSDEDKIERFNAYIKNKKNDNEIPIDILIRTQLDKMNLVSGLKKSVKDFRDGSKMNTTMDIMTGKKGVSQESYLNSKERHLENIKKKGKKKKK